MPALEGDGVVESSDLPGRIPCGSEWRHSHPFRVDSEQEAIDRALGLLVEEERIVGGLHRLRGTLRGDGRAWPYL